MKDFKKDYFVQASRDFKEDFFSYLNNAKYNFVIMVEDEPIVWETDKAPVIFGSKQDAFDEISNWETMRNISIITEEEFLYHYCKEEVEKYIYWVR